MEVCEILNILSDLDEFGAGQTPLQRRLELIREIQRVIPSAHVGGSIGLLLQGIDLGRDFTDSDIDFSISKPSGDFFPIIDVKRGDRFYQKKITMSSTEMDEADYFTDITNPKNPGDIKVEFKYDRTQSYDSVKYNGHTYRVTHKNIIIGWKVLFASRNSKKHMEDLDKIGCAYLKKNDIFNPWKSSYKTWEELKFDLVEQNLMEWK